jgi:hypothetical protein
MIIGTAPTSKGRFHIMAEVRGSYGEVIRRRVGRLHTDAATAVAAAERYAEQTGAKHVEVCSTREVGWVFTVRA